MFLAALLVLSPLSPPGLGDTIYKRDGTQISNVRARITQKHIIYTNARGKTIRLPLKTVKRIVRKKLKTPKAPKFAPVKKAVPEVKKVTPLKPEPLTPPPKTKKGRTYLKGFIPGWSGFYSTGQYKYGIIFSMLEILAAYYYVIPWTESSNTAHGKVYVSSGGVYLTSLLLTMRAATETNGAWTIGRVVMQNKVTRPTYEHSLAEQIYPELLLFRGKLISKDTYQQLQIQYIGAYLLLLTADVLAAWYFGKPQPSVIKKSADRGPRFNLSVLPGKTGGLRMGLMLKL